MTFFRFLLVLVCALGVSQAAGAQVLTLDEAVRRALDQGPDAALASATLLSAQAVDAQAQARAGFTVTSNLAYQAAKGVNDPVNTTTNRVSSLASPADDIVPQQVTGTVTAASPQTTVTVTGAQTFQFNPDGQMLKSASFGTTLNQTLFSGYAGGSTQAAADKSRLTIQSAQLTAQANRNRVVLNVRTAFLTLVAAQERAALQAQALAQRQEALRFTQARAATGTVTAYDLKVAQTAVRSAELDLIGFQNALTTARSRLANLLGTPLATPMAQADLGAVALPPLAEAVETALKNRVEPQTATLSAQASAIDAAVASGASLPTVALTGGVSYAASTTLSGTVPTDSSSLVGTVGVRITPPALDFGLAAAQALQARTQQNIAQTQADQLRRSIPVDVQDAWATCQLNGQRVDLAQAQLENADVNRLIVKSQFDSGVRPVADWLNAEVAYSSAQLALVNSRLTWQLSAVTLQNLMGN